jgi:hypothetical protein
MEHNCFTSAPTARDSSAHPIGLGYGHLQFHAPQRGAITLRHRLHSSRPFRPQTMSGINPGRWPGLRNDGPLGLRDGSGDRKTGRSCAGFAKFMWPSFSVTSEKSSSDPRPLNKSLDWNDPGPVFISNSRNSNLAFTRLQRLRHFRSI